METSSRLTANQRLQIAVKITELQAGQPKDRANNPFPRSRYIEVITSVLGRQLPSNTTRRILDDLGIEPRETKKPDKRTEFTSIRTKNVAEIKERLAAYQEHLARLSASIVRIEEKLDTLITQLKE